MVRTGQGVPFPMQDGPAGHILALRRVGVKEELSGPISAWRPQAGPAQSRPAARGDGAVSGASRARRDLLGGPEGASPPGRGPLGARPAPSKKRRFPIAHARGRACAAAPYIGASSVLSVIGSKRCMLSMFTIRSTVSPLCTRVRGSTRATNCFLPVSR